MNSPVVAVLTEISAGRLTTPSRQTLRFASKLASVLNGTGLMVVTPGEDASPPSMEIVEAGWRCIVLSGDRLKPYHPETWKAVLSSFFRETGAAYVCIPHTSRGWDLAPSLAFRLGGAMITAVESVRREGGQCIFTRSLYNGRLRADMTVKVTPAVITVLAGTDNDSTKSGMQRPGMESERLIHRLFTKGDTVPLSAAASARIRPLGTFPPQEEPYDDLQNAEVICSVGRGIGRADDIGLIHDLARLFRKSAVGCTRPVCDAGWLPFNRQIGLTGKTVSPTLYIACGISGTPQHLAGMKDARIIIAVNRDPRAAIFQVAHYGVVADLCSFLRAVLAYRNAKGGKK